MAQARDSHFNPSSPRSSSGGADSFKGTPDTRLTAFSPEDGSAKSSKLLKDLARSASATPPVRLPVNSSRGSISNLDKDPFVTPTHGQATRLSPTASTFRPFTDAAEQSLLSSPSPVASALSTDLGLSRHLKLASSDPLSASEVDAWLADQELSGAHRHGGKYLAAIDGHVLIQFADIRDASSVHASIRSAENDWKADYVSQLQLSKDGIAAFGQTGAQISQLLVLAAIPPGTIIDTVQAMATVEGFLESHGRLFAFVRRSTFADGSFRAVAEFCHSSAALAALASCGNGLVIAGIHVVLAPHAAETLTPGELADSVHEISLSKGGRVHNQHPDATESSTPRPVPSADVRMPPPFSMYPLMLQSPYNPGMPYMLDRLVPASHAGPLAPMTPMAPMSPPYPVVGPLYQTPPSPALTAQHSFSPSRSSSSFGRPDARRQNASRVNRSPYHNAAGHHNHVDVSRIREGIDVRTTIMLRNIPNKVDQAMLKRIVDESSWGKYDFMYLRIDFANDCNVGYAFINFVDPLDIVDFVDARGNQRWNCFKSDKVAEISYATIQGKDCLVQKFRNSSVMLEAPHYRPKLYFTSNGPMPEMAGQEEPFPEPDNQSKMKRSCENAEHVGLFTPNAGQHFRDEQRRRRSQYDRGTRLAALEEYDYEAAMQHLYHTGAQ